MTKKITLLAALFLTSVCTWAQEWTKPAAPAAAALETGAECYLYNVGADGFYMGAYDWSTRACVQPTRGYKVYVEPYQTAEVAWDNQSYFITSYIEDGSPAGKVMCLFTDGVSSIWVDREKDAAVDKAFTFEDAGNGTFRIGLSPQNQEYNPIMFPNTYLGVLPSKGETRLYLTSLEDEPTAQIVWQFVKPADYQQYVLDIQQWQAAVKLGAAIDAAKKSFPNVDISSVTNVYQNHASTAEELSKAEAALTTLLIQFASPETPVDVTQFITNPSYDKNENSGWTGTAPAFQYWNNAEFFNKTFETSQVVPTGQPGVYMAAVTAFYRAGGADEDAQAQAALEEQETSNKQLAQLFTTSGAIGQLATPLPFISTGASEEAIGWNTVKNTYGYVPNDMQTAGAYFQAGQFQATSVCNYTSDGLLTIGLSKTDKLDNDWTLFDDWKLFYLGNDDAALAYLRDLRLKAWPDYVGAVTYGDLIYYGQAAFEEYKAAVTALTAATTADNIVPALAAFEKAALAFSKNVEAYAAYYAAYSETDEFMKAHQDDLMGDAIDLLTDYLWEDSEPRADFPHPNGSGLYILQNGTLSTEEIIAETAYLLKLKDEALAEGMGDGMDCTDLIKNPHFQSAEGWTKEGLPEFPVGPEDYRMGQAYTILFGVSQEIKGLQNGLYELSLNDFYRPADPGSTDYTENYRAYVFMNDFKKKMNFIDNEALELPDETASQPIAGVGYVPNTLDEAAKAFQAGRYRQSLYGLVTDGVMKIGVRSDLRYEGCWAVFTDFKLTFRAKNPEVLADVISTTVPQAEEMLEEKCGTEELNALSAAINAASMAAAEDCYDAMGALQEAMDAVTEGVSIYSNLNLAIQNLQEAIEQKPDAKDIDAAKALLAQAEEAYAAGSLNNAAAAALAEEVSVMVVNIKLGGGSGEKEQDFSDLIVNRNFDPAKGSKDEGRIDGWTTTAMNGYKQFTVSYNRAPFELYQDLSGLPKGKYKVTVHTYYRAGYWYDEEEHLRNGEETHLTTLYAQTSADKAEKPVLTLTEGAVAADKAPEGVNVYTLSNGLVAPDGTTPTAAFFNAGYYLNEMEFTVPADGKVRIGLSKTEVYPNDYEVVGEWSLYYYGDPDAVQEEDYTSLIVNNNFDPAKGSKDEGRIDGWTTTAMNGYKQYTVSYNRAPIELYQDLSGLPKGNYKVTVHTYYRAGYWYDEEEHMRNGEETHLTTLYAQTSADRAEKPVLNLTEGAVSADKAPEGVNVYTLSNGLVAPDGTTPTAAFFDAGYYLNSLKFAVPADGKVRIGLSKTEVYPNDYEVVGAWHLYYLGKSGGEDAVESITRTAAPVGVFTLSGTRANGLHRGINIVRMPDGTVRKVMVR